MVKWKGEKGWEGNQPWQKGWIQQTDTPYWKGGNLGDKISNKPLKVAGSKGGHSQKEDAEQKQRQEALRVKESTNYQQLVQLIDQRWEARQAEIGNKEWKLESWEKEEKTRH